MFVFRGQRNEFSLSTPVKGKHPTDKLVPFSLSNMTAHYTSFLPFLEYFRKIGIFPCQKIEDNEVKKSSLKTNKLQSPITNLFLHPFDFIWILPFCSLDYFEFSWVWRCFWSVQSCCGNATFRIWLQGIIGSICLSLDHSYYTHQ